MSAHTRTYGFSKFTYNTNQMPSLYLGCLGENAIAEMMTAVPSPRVGTGLTCEGRADIFYSLEPISKQPSIKSYWSNLTVEAMIVYEKVYDIARDPHTGWVHCE